MCVLHDRHVGLLNAINTLQSGAGELLLLPDLHSHWCMWHLGANFYKQFRSKRLMDLFKKLCKQNQRRKSNAWWEELDKLTSRQMDKVWNNPVVAREEEPEGLKPLQLEPQSVIRRRTGEKEG